MSMITVEVVDGTGNRRESVQLPDDVPVNRILVKLVEKMGLPTRHPDGRPLVYKFHHPAAGQIRDDSCLRDAGVHDNDMLRIFQELIAGGD